MSSPPPSCHPRVGGDLLSPGAEGEAISKKKRGAELSLRTPNRGEAIPKKGGEGEASPCLQPCPSVTLERSDRVQGKSSVTPSAGARRPATPRPLRKKNNAGGKPSVIC